MSAGNHGKRDAGDLSMVDQFFSRKKKAYCADWKPPLLNRMLAVCPPWPPCVVKHKAATAAKRAALCLAKKVSSLRNTLFSVREKWSTRLRSPASRFPSLPALTYIGPKPWTSSLPWNNAHTVFTFLYAMHDLRFASASSHHTFCLRNTSKACGRFFVKRFTSGDCGHL